MKKIIPLIIFVLALIPFFRSEAPALEKASVTELANQSVISVWGFVPEEKLAVAFEQFKARYPETEIRYQQFRDPDEYEKVLNKNLGKATGPDVFFFSAAKKEVFHDLESVPFDVDALKIFYNKRYFPNGIESKWQDFAEQLRGIKIAGIAMGRLDNTRYGWDLLKALILQKGLERKDEAISFFKRFADPNDRYFNWTDVLNKDYPDQEIDSFVKEKIATLAAYSGDVSMIQQKVAEMVESKRPHLRQADLVEAPLPQFDRINPKYFARMIMVGLSKSSSKNEKAEALLQLLADKSPEAKFAEYYMLEAGMKKEIEGRFSVISTD